MIYTPIKYKKLDVSSVLYTQCLSYNIAKTSERTHIVSYADALKNVEPRYKQKANEVLNKTRNIVYNKINNIIENARTEKIAEPIDENNPAKDTTSESQAKESRISRLKRFIKTNPNIKNNENNDAEPNVEAESNGTQTKLNNKKISAKISDYFKSIKVKSEQNNIENDNEIKEETQAQKEKQETTLKKFKKLFNDFINKKEDKNNDKPQNTQTTIDDFNKNTSINLKANDNIIIEPPAYVPTENFVDKATNNEEQPRLIERLNNQISKLSGYVFKNLSTISKSNSTDEASDAEKKVIEINPKDIVIESNKVSENEIKQIDASPASTNANNNNSDAKVEKKVGVLKEKLANGKKYISLKTEKAKKFIISLSNKAKEKTRVIYLQVKDKFTQSDIINNSDSTNNSNMLLKNSLNNSIESCEKTTTNEDINAPKTRMTTLDEFMK